MYPDDSEDLGSLLKQADMAMYRAKENSSAYEFYQTFMDEHVSQRLDLEKRFTWCHRAWRI